MISVRRRAQLGLLATLVVLIGAISTLMVAPRYSKRVAVADVGTVAPDFQLEDLEGRTFTLSQHRGQAVVLFFGSATCPRTTDYNSRIQRLARTYANDTRVKFFALDITPRNQMDRHLLRLDRNVAGRGFATLVDDRRVVAGRYSAIETPTFVVLDPRGVVRYRGPFDDSADLAFVTHSFCAEALGDVLGAPTSAVAGSFRP